MIKTAADTHFSPKTPSNNWSLYCFMSCPLHHLRQHNTIIRRKRNSFVINMIKHRVNIFLEDRCLLREHTPRFVLTTDHKKRLVYRHVHVYIMNLSFRWKPWVRIRVGGGQLFSASSAQVRTLRPSQAFWSRSLQQAVEDPVPVRGSKDYSFFGIHSLHYALITFFVLCTVSFSFIFSPPPSPSDWSPILPPTRF